jgi:glycosyltransferase involved in cell wall biosynthesis
MTTSPPPLLAEPPPTFDEERYLAANIDVAIAVAEKWFPSGWAHYQLHGRAEGRLLDQTIDPSMKVAVCLYVRDEEHTIKEWLAYQFAIGFDACIVYDNGSVDATPRLVQEFRHGDVRLVPWPSNAPDAHPAAYRECLREFGTAFDWIAFIDSDEFIVPKFGTIKNLLTTYRDRAAIAINRAMFGSSGHIEAPAALVIESFTRRAPKDFDVHQTVKSIVRPSEVISLINTHSFDVKGAYVQPNGQPVQWRKPGVMLAEADYSICQINHYFTRSRSQWNVKVRRGYHGETAPRTAEEFATYDRNEIEDESALRFASRVHRLLS